MDSSDRGFSDLQLVQSEAWQGPERGIAEGEAFYIFYFLFSIGVLGRRDDHWQAE